MGVEAVSAKASLTVDTQVEVLGFFAGCIHDTALVAGLVPKTGTFNPQNLAPVCDLQVGITKKHQPNQTKRHGRSSLNDGLLNNEVLKHLLSVFVPVDCGKGQTFYLALQTDPLRDEGCDVVRRARPFNSRWNCGTDQITQLFEVLEEFLIYVV